MLAKPWAKLLRRPADLGFAAAMLFLVIAIAFAVAVEHRDLCGHLLVADLVVLNGFVYVAGLHKSPAPHSFAE